VAIGARRGVHGPRWRDCFVPGETYTLKYRIMIYDGLIDSLKAENYWTDFAHPPQVVQQQQ
jgi:hypothetical protein